MNFEKTPPELRKRQVKALKHYHKTHNEQCDEWAARHYCYPLPNFIPFPEICRGMKCEATTRKGTPCKNDGTGYSSGRCKYHGGASTGPLTQEGKKIASQNGLKRRTLCTPNKT